MANIVWKVFFFFQVEIKKNPYQNSCTTNQAATTQMTIPFDKLPCTRGHCVRHISSYVFGSTYIRGFTKYLEVLKNPESPNLYIYTENWQHMVPRYSKQVFEMLLCTTLGYYVRNTQWLSATWWYRFGLTVSFFLALVLKSLSNVNFFPK